MLSLKISISAIAILTSAPRHLVPNELYAPCVCMTTINSLCMHRQLAESHSQNLPFLYSQNKAAVRSLGTVTDELWMDDSAKVT